MAVGQFIDFAPGPAPGSYAFQRIDGSPLIASGPEAENLARALERQKGMGPQPVAQNSMDSLAGVGGYGNRADVAPPIPAVQTPAAAPAPSGPPPSIARPPEQPAARAPGLQPIARTRTGVIVRDPVSGQMFEQTGGSQGVSKEQLQARAANSVAVPVSTAESVQGGYDRNPEYEEQLQNATIDQRLANQQQADALQAGAQREGDFYSAQVAKQAEVARRDQQYQQEVGALHTRDMQQLEQALEEVRTAKVEPTRKFSGVGGTISLITSAIAGGLGALGAGLARTPNFALDVINRAIDRDVAAQESELAKKKDSANNMLRQWMASGATLEQAKAATKASQIEHARMEVAKIAAINKSQQVQASALAMDAELEKGLAEQLERYRIESLGKRSAEVSSRMAQPQAGSRGGLMPLTLDEAGTIAGIRKTEAEAGKTGSRGEGAQKAAGQVEVLGAIGKRLMGHDAKEEAFAPENQNIVTRGLRGAVNTVAGDRTWVPGTEAQRQGAQEFDQIKNDLMAQTSVANGQGAMSDPEAQRAMRAIGEARTWGDLQRAHQYLLEKTVAAARGFGVNAAAPPRPEDVGMVRRGPQ